MRGEMVLSKIGDIALFKIQAWRALGWVG